MALSPPAAAIGPSECQLATLLPPLLLNEGAMDTGATQPVEAAMNS